MSEDRENLDGPAAVEALIGHRAQQTAFLESHADNSLHHAWLLTGPKGVGKASFAWLAAKYLLGASAVQDGPGLFGDPEPITSFSAPLSDPVVHRIATGGHADLRVITREKNSKTGKMKTEITVDQIQALGNLFTLSSGEGGWRVVIIDSADDMNRSAANSVLKMLEEPPANCIFLLVSHRPGRLLPTIKSRCRPLAFSRLSAEEMDQYSAIAGLGSDPVVLDLAEGSPGRALRLKELNATRVADDMTRLVTGANGITPQFIKPYQTSEDATALALDFLDTILCGAAGAKAPQSFAVASASLSARVPVSKIDDIAAQIRTMAAQQTGLRMDRGFFWLAVGEALRNGLSSR